MLKLFDSQSLIRFIMSHSTKKIKEIRQLLHDTLSQTLFSASTFSGVLLQQLASQHENSTQLAQELDILLKDAVSELQAIQTALNEAEDEH